MYKTFIFKSYNFNKENKTLKLNYSFDNELNFTEEIVFPSKKILSNNDTEALNNVFKYLHIVAGISYYKLFLPKKIIIETIKLDKQQADFFNSFYINGLGEFSYRNNIKNLNELINFPYDLNTKNTPNNYKLNKRYAIPVGGGKDSIVTIETLKQFGQDFICCSVNTAISIEKTMEIANTPSFQVKRIIDKKLLDINKNLKQYNAYNGHVPITGILAFILCASSIIYDYNTILISNERSANIGNIEFCGNNINHQWSKSFEFEKSVNEFFKRYVLENFNYISFLRPLYEYEIARRFSKLTKYHKIFTSCNKAFKIENRLSNWCCNCDKCRFVFLILSNFLSKKELINIFSKDLLNDKNQLLGFKQLVGLTDFKPFECVGEIEESICALLNVDESFKNDYIVSVLTNELQNKYDKNDLREKYLSIKNDNNLLNMELFRHISKQ